MLKYYKNKQNKYIASELIKLNENFDYNLLLKLLNEKEFYNLAIELTINKHSLVQSYFLKNTYDKLLDYYNDSLKRC